MSEAAIEDTRITGWAEALRRGYLKYNIAIILTLFVLALGAFQVVEHVQSGAVRFLMQRFYHDIELSVPTIYNFFLIVANFGLLFAIALGTRAQRATGLIAWSGLALIFLLLAYDEAVGLHEELARRLRDVLPTGPFLKYAWTPVGVVAVIVVAVIFIPFLRALPRRVARLMVIAGAVYVTGAIVVETAGGWLDFYFGQIFAYQVVSGLEESMEMGGMVLFGYALMTYIAKTFRPSIARSA